MRLPGRYFPDRALPATERDRLARVARGAKLCIDAPSNRWRSDSGGLSRWGLAGRTGLVETRER